MQYLPTEGDIQVKFSIFNVFIGTLYNKTFCHLIRELPSQCRIFLFMVEGRRLFNVHKQDSCGDLLLFLRHSLARRYLTFYFTKLRMVPMFIKELPFPLS